MSKRTSQANRAIAEAWKKEQILVCYGMGTRDWTLEQQRDILEKGKAYDSNGIAFEGQHMKSVERYPEYQGDMNNIQFLSKKEHLEAHKGSWQNPTNWYYDYQKKEYIDFGEDIYIPCEVVKLSNVYQIYSDIKTNSNTNLVVDNKINQCSEVDKKDKLSISSENNLIDINVNHVISSSSRYNTKKGIFGFTWEEIGQATITFGKEFVLTLFDCDDECSEEDTAYPVEIDHSNIENSVNIESNEKYETNESRKLPRKHPVKGHQRTLREGQHASVKKIKEAEEQGVTLELGKTWVKDYHTGQDKE